MSERDLNIQHPDINRCACGGIGEVSWPCYADESAAVFCQECDEMGEGFDMGQYHEGVTKAIESWNRDNARG